MKQILLVALLTIQTIAHCQPKQALFIGNSYTGVNNLPKLVRDIGLSLGDSLQVDKSVLGGYQFVQHASNQGTLDKINAQNWDFVILQEQSQKPSFNPEFVAAEVLPYAAQLDSSIKANYSCTETIFYMTWGRKNGDADNCSWYTPVCTYEGMQQRLRESYLLMAENNNAMVSPVGIAWKNVRENYPNIELYTSDGSHPSIHGSYLAACVFYTTMFQKSCIGAAYVPNGITQDEAAKLQTIASNTVLDSVGTWRINANKTLANFNYTYGAQIQFNNLSTNNQYNYWDFGDGNHSTAPSPSHQYVNEGNYTVALITFSNDSCYSDTMYKAITVYPTNTNEISSLTPGKIFPNPVKDALYSRFNHNPNRFTITDLTGKIILSGNYKDSISITDLKEGIYFIRFENDQPTHQVFKFLKY